MTTEEIDNQLGAHPETIQVHAIDLAKLILVLLKDIEAILGNNAMRTAMDMLMIMATEDSNNNNPPMTTMVDRDTT